MKSIYFWLAGLLAVLPACSGKGGGSTIHDNPFDTEGEASIGVSYTSNADSVFMKLDISGDLAFDQISVRDENGKNDLTLKGSQRECTLTHIPANVPTKVTVTLLSQGEKVDETLLYMRIDGLDATLLHLIIPDKGSVTAGDGMYSIGLPDGRSIFLMGDSYTGEVQGIKRVSGNHMYRNTYSVYDPATKKSFAITGPNEHSAAVPPGQPNETEWYWPGHGFVSGNTLYIFQSLMYQGSEGMWGFMYRNTHLLEYSLPDITLKSDNVIPFTGPDNIHYGAAAMADGDYLYIYAQVDVENGLSPVTEVRVGRTTPGQIRTHWEYWNGKAWVDGADSAVKLDGLTTVPVSSQFNVFKLRDKYVLLTRDKRMWVGEVYTWISDNPQGPWRNKKLIYEITPLEQDNWFTYNAMAHPQLERDNMIPVSYCVNTDVFAEQFSNVYSYRPRFFWVEVDDILH